MFDRARSVVCSRSTSFRRDCTWLDSRAGGEPRDEVVQLRDLLFPLRVLGLDSRADLHLGQHHVVVAAGVGDDRLVIDVGDVRAHRVQKVAVVRDHDQGAVVAHEEFPKPVNRVEVEVVRRFVEQQRLGMSEKRLRQQHANFLPSLQLAHLPFVHLVGDVQSLQQNRRVALGCVSVFFADNAFEFTEPHAVFVGHVALAVKHFTFFERAPQASVPHDDGVDDAKLVKGELILPENAELLRANHRALLRRDFSSQQLHERRFAGAVGACQAVPAAA